MPCQQNMKIVREKLVIKACTELAEVELEKSIKVVLQVQ